MDNVVRIPGPVNQTAEVLIMKPCGFEEIPQVIQALRERKTVVLNLTLMDPERAQRAVDFAAGGTYSIQGELTRIGQSIFLFTPSCVLLKLVNL